MNPSILMAIQIIQSLPGLIAAGIEVKGLIDEHTAKLADMATTGRSPTADEWAELNAQITSLRIALHGK